MIFQMYLICELMMSPSKWTTLQMLGHFCLLFGIRGWQMSVTDHWWFLPPSKVSAGWEDLSQQMRLHGRWKQHPAQRKLPPPNHQIPRICDRKTPGGKPTAFRPAPLRKMSQEPSSGNETPATKYCLCGSLIKSKIVRSERTNPCLTSGATLPWSSFIMDRSRSSSTRTKIASNITKHTTVIWKQHQAIRKRELSWSDWLIKEASFCSLDDDLQLTYYTNL